jgi:hypothetical protein
MGGVGVEFVGCVGIPIYDTLLCIVNAMSTILVYIHV